MFAAGELQQGLLCPCCQQPIQTGQTVGACPDCRHVQHEHCWGETGRCHSYECGPPLGRKQADLVISPDDVARAPVPPPHPRIAAPGWSPVGSSVRKRLSILALLAFVCSMVGAFAIVGIFAFDALYFFGAWVGLPAIGFIFGVPGLLAIVLGSIAIGFINSRRDTKGAGFAAAGIVVGLVGLMGGLAGLCLVVVGGGHDVLPPFERPEIIRPDQVFGETDDSAVSEPIRRAIRANVMINVRTATAAASGSGVVIANRDGEVVIITNRHVVDGAGKGLLSGGSPGVTITFADGSHEEATVKWRAAGGIDIALITCPAGDNSFAVARVASRSTLNIGESVFAIGNPLNLNWSYAKGVISAIRRGDLSGGALRIIQMQLPLNPGNSGGGLYRQDGGLIGINTFTVNRTAAEGISFSIAVLDLIPQIEKNGALTLERTPSTPTEEETGE